MTNRSAPRYALLALVSALVTTASLARRSGATPLTGVPCLALPGDCRGASDTTRIGDAETKILFIGNSLTAMNDLPGIVQALAGSAGLSVRHAVIMRPGYSLEDHWHDGVADRIAEAAADFVVLQQGPSSLPESGEQLTRWTEVLAAAIRNAGGVPVLLMVWPPLDRAAAFPAVRDHYAAAARRVQGALVPAGQTWLEARALDPALELYGPDRFHPSYLGSLAAAHTLVAVLLGLEPDSIPALDDHVPPQTLAVIRAAVAASIDRWAIPVKR